MRNITKISFAAAASLSAFALAAPAVALPTIVGACSPTDLDPDAVLCSGWFDGNLLNNSGTHVQDQIDALALIGFAWDGNWAAVDATKIGPVDPNAEPRMYDFPGLFNGETWIGIHKGKGGKDGFEGTAFYKLDLPNLDIFSLELKGGSSAVLYFTNGAPAVPEPATWGLMIAGFGLVGGVLRRTRRQSVSVKYA